MSSSTFLSQSKGSFGSPLKLVVGGYRSTSTGNLYEDGIVGNYWSVGLQPNSDTRLQKLKWDLLTCNIKVTDYGKEKEYSRK